MGNLGPGAGVAVLVNAWLGRSGGLRTKSQP